MLDPLLLRLIAMLFALLLITAAAHKLGDLLRFQGILRDYRILPEQLIGVVSLLVPCAEVLLGFGWVFLWRIDLVSAMTAALLTAYAIAMGINLMRGRTYIDCGCGFSSSRTKTGNSGIQQLSSWLVYRNLVLIVLAVIASTGISTSARSFGALDYFSIIAATLALVFAYGAFNQLLVNHNAIASWRDNRSRGDRSRGDSHD